MTPERPPCHHTVLHAAAVKTPRLVSKYSCTPAPSHCFPRRELRITSRSDLSESWSNMEQLLTEVTPATPALDCTIESSSFSSCLCLTLTTQQPFPPVNSDGPPSPFPLVGSFLHLKLKLKFHQLQALLHMHLLCFQDVSFQDGASCRAPYNRCLLYTVTAPRNRALSDLVPSTGHMTHTRLCYLLSIKALTSFSK